MEGEEVSLTSKITSDMWADFDQALKDREPWDQEQQDYLIMRYEGMGRPQLPYPNAPDVHYPLIDTIIEKLKPFFIQQIYQPTTLATFVIEPPDSSGSDSDAESKFDYELKHRSNFELEDQRVIDKMLQCGNGVLKIGWDADEKQLCYYSVDPNYCIVPAGTEDIQGTDWFIHVLHFSIDGYKREKNFKQGDEFVSMMKGRGVAPQSGQNMEQIRQLKNQRDGLTYHSNKNMIVLWEIYTRRDDGKGWEFTTISPVLGWEKGVVRGDTRVPYDHNELPFCEYRLETAEPGFYSSRGVAALLKAHELMLDKFWNYLLQYLDFSALPTYDNDGTTVTNSTNLQKEPGLILPPGVTQSETIKAPVDFIQQMESVRALAENRIQVPDLSSSEHLAGKPGSRGDVTATQVSAIVGQSNQGNDMRSRIFKLYLSKAYRQSWSILVQYKYTEYKKLPREVIPSGSADSWDRAARSAQAMALFQLLNGDQFTQQGPLRKNLLENSGTDMVSKLYQDPQPPPPAPQDPMETVKAMATLLTAMSNVTRVGVPLTRDDYSSVLSSIGLPPLPEGPPGHVGEAPGGPPAPHELQHDQNINQHNLDAAGMLLDHTQDNGQEPDQGKILDLHNDNAQRAHDMQMSREQMMHERSMQAQEHLQSAAEGAADRDLKASEGAATRASGERTAMAKGGVVSGKKPVSQSGKQSGSGKSQQSGGNESGIHVHLPDAIKHSFETPEAPKIQVNVPEIKIPEIHMPEPKVNVTVNVPDKGSKIEIGNIKHDKDGKIVSATITRRK